MEVRAGKVQITPQGHFPNRLKKQGQELKNKWGIVDPGEVTNGSSSGGAGKKSFLSTVDRLTRPNPNFPIQASAVVQRASA